MYEERNLPVYFLTEELGMTEEMVDFDELYLVNYLIRSYLDCLMKNYKWKSFI